MEWVLKQLLPSVGVKQYKWGQTPIAHAKVSDYRKTIHVQLGSVPTCTVFFIFPPPPLV